MKTVLILCLKDLYLNRSGIAGAWTVTGLFIAMGLTMKPPSNAAIAFQLACSVTMIACIPVAEWLVYREKVKGTIALLRALPVSDAAIVFSKFAANFIILGSIFGVCTAVGAPGYWRPGNLLNILRAFCGLQLFGVMLISGRFAFGQKAGAVVPILLGLGLVEGYIELQKRAPARAESLGQLAISGPGTFAICVATLLIAAFMCVLVGQWLSSRDTSQLAE